MNVFCPHCSFGPQRLVSGGTVQCPVCKQLFTVSAFEPTPPTVVRMTRRKRNPIAVWLNIISLVVSLAGALMAWRAFTIRDPELLNAAKAVAITGVLMYVGSRIAHYFD